MSIQDRLGRKLTIAEAAEYTGLSVGQLYRLTHQHRIRCLRTDGRVLERQQNGRATRYVKSGRLYFFERHLDEWIDAHLSGGTSVTPAQRTRAPETSAETSALDRVMPRERRFAR